MSDEPLLHPFDQLLEIERRSHNQPLPAPEPASPALMTRGVAVRLAAWRLLFPLEEVAEITPLPQYTPVPGVKSWLKGIANLRGMVISIVDLRNFLCGESTIPGPRSRIVVVRSGDWGYGLLVDDAIGMRQFNAADRLPELAELDSAIQACLTDAFRSEGCSWGVFSTERLSGNPQFLSAAN